MKGTRSASGNLSNYFNLVGLALNRPEKAALFSTHSRAKPELSETPAERRLGVGFAASPRPKPVTNRRSMRPAFRAARVQSRLQTGAPCGRLFGQPTSKAGYKPALHAGGFSGSPRPKPVTNRRSTRPAFRPAHVQSRLQTSAPRGRLFGQPTSKAGYKPALHAAGFSGSV
jgi:hypothetical protein